MRRWKTKRNWDWPWQRHGYLVLPQCACPEHIWGGSAQLNSVYRERDRESNGNANSSSPFIILSPQLTLAAPDSCRQIYSYSSSHSLPQLKSRSFSILIFSPEILCPYLCVSTTATQIPKIAERLNLKFRLGALREPQIKVSIQNVTAEVPLYRIDFPVF